MRQHIVVTEYSPEWAAEFERESEMIKNILKDNCVAIHHIGSTAVAGLKAKPIIDMMPIVADLRKVDALASEFEKIGYEYLGNSELRQTVSSKGRSGKNAPNTHF